MNIAVLFDGGGLARLGLEQAGHICTGFEFDPFKHYLSTLTGSGNCILGDVLNHDFTSYDAVWASPPCQWLSRARTQGDPVSAHATDYVQWCLNLPHKILWVENVVRPKFVDNLWGIKYNAAQFESFPRQNRCRIIGGKYILPKTCWPYMRKFKNAAPTITATEYKGCASDKRRSSRHFGRKLTLEECVKLQGLPQEILTKWYKRPSCWPYTYAKWIEQLYETVGNGVPPFMSKAFGMVYA